MIQFARYAPKVAERGGRVILECHPGLRRLLTRLPGIEKVVTPGEPPAAFDLYCPILSLPHIFGTRLDTIPAATPYLQPAEDEMARWHERIIAHAPRRLKVGLAWAGRPEHKNDRNRSLRLSQLTLLASNEITFFSLQKGPPAAEVALAPPNMRVIDLMEACDDLADTAALIANLDLIVCVDTAVAHLAGAMGKRVWTLLPFNPDWRWMRERDDSPWYPTMRLFRQSLPGGWDEVIERLGRELRDCVSS